MFLWCIKTCIMNFMMHFVVFAAFLNNVIIKPLLCFMEESKSEGFGLYGSILVCIFLHSPILKLTGFVLFIKVTVHPKFKIYWKCIHPQVIQELDELLSVSEQIWGNLALHHLLASLSSAVNGCRQNDSPNSW